MAGTWDRPKNTETINILPDEPTPQVTLQEAAVIATEKIGESYQHDNDKMFGMQQLDAI